MSTYLSHVNSVNLRDLLRLIALVIAGSDYTRDPVLNQSSHHYQIALGLLRDVSDYFNEQSDAFGRVLCERHRVEHTGKNCYTIIIDTILHQKTDEASFFSRAHRRALRVAHNLVRDPDSGVWIFYPGRLLHWNVANSVIDGGACADALATFYEAFEHRLSPADKELLLDVLWRHVDTYLKIACVEKEVNNQRLWGATGVAAAYRLHRESSWRDAVIASIQRSLAEQNADGSFPYHSYVEDYGIHPGARDVSAYYHSRHVAFMLRALEALDVPLDNYLDPIRRAVDFLCAIYRPNGIKEITFDGKRWYWNSPYEVASNPFDIFALARVGSLLGEPFYAAWSARSLEQLAEHQLPDGGISSHRGPQWNFQCRIFWNGHMGWLARALDYLPDQTLCREPRSAFFPDAGVARLESRGVCALMRTNKQPANNYWGASLGGGPVYVSTPDAKWANVLSQGAWYRPSPPHIFARSTGRILPTFDLTFFRDEMWSLRDLRALVYKARLALFRARRPKEALRVIFKDIIQPVLWFLIPRNRLYSTQWATNASSQWKDNVLTLRLRPSTPGGRALPTVEVERTFRVNDGHLQCEDVVTVDSSVSMFWIELGSHLRTLKSSIAPARRRGGRIAFAPASAGQSSVRLTYTIEATGGRSD